MAITLKKQKRITAALDGAMISFLEKISAQDDLSYSEIIRRALNFYQENRAISTENMKTYLNLLSNGEHVIIDIEHWFLFLNFIESSQNQETFWTKHREVARSHGGQLKNTVVTVEDLLNRLEVCNFFKVIKTSENNFTLILRSELTKKFIIFFLEGYFSEIGIKAELKENLSKINIRTQPTKKM